MATENPALPMLEKSANSLADKLTPVAQPLTASVSSLTTTYPWIKYVIIFLVVSFILFVLGLYFVKQYFNIDLNTIMSVISAIPKAKAGDQVKADPKAKVNADEKGIAKKSAVNVLGEKMDKANKKDTAVPTVADNEPQPDDAGSVTQAAKGKSKSGYCYIGEDRGFRSCIKVGEGDKCMSGDIFPSQDICINPTLRE